MLLTSSLQSNKNSIDANIYLIGQVIKFDDKLWIAVHEDNNLLYLMSQYIISITVFGENNIYAGSTLASVAARYENEEMSSSALNQIADTNVNGVTSKIFVPSREQVFNEFTYFLTGGSRIAKRNSYSGQVWQWWTSSVYNNTTSVSYVTTDGSLSSTNTMNQSQYGFRPFVALKI